MHIHVAFRQHYTDILFYVITTLVYSWTIYTVRDGINGSDSTPDVIVAASKLPPETEVSFG